MGSKENKDGEHIHVRRANNLKRKPYIIDTQSFDYIEEKRRHENSKTYFYEPIREACRKYHIKVIKDPNISKQ